MKNKNPVLYNLFISFGVFSSAEIDHILSQFESKIFKKGAVVLDFGEMNDKLYFIESGIRREFSIKDQITVIQYANGLGCYWNYNATSNSAGQNLSSVASYSYTKTYTYSFIDYDGDTITFSNTSSVNNIINQAFDFTYNGNTNYSSGGVSQPIIAGCF